MSEKMRVLVVDDEKEIRVTLQEILEEEGYEAFLAQNAEEARALLAQGIDCALVDIKLGSDNGIELLGFLKRQQPQLPVIMISGHGTVALAAEAFKLGAHEFMEKPLRLIQVRACVRNALESVRLKQRVTAQERDKHPRPIYTSEVMKTLFSQAMRLASLTEPVVIMGPSGAGKELVARSLHFDGSRRDGPFIATNAASLPVNLAEDELFGHEKGAFTGATARRCGCLEQADGGTLFLDEIADMDLQVQAKLLRVLENGQLTRLGGSKPLSVNVRIVAATHKDLGAMAQDGSFRHDLWYRLCAFVLRVPSLEERREDIAALAQSFLQRVCAEMSIDRSLAPAALDSLTRRTYPGNIRELKHLITRAAVLCDTPVIDEAAIARVTGTGPSQPAATTVAAGGVYDRLDFRGARVQFEKDYLNAALSRNDNNITLTAAAIGMAQSNLSRKLKELGLR